MNLSDLKKIQKPSWLGGKKAEEEPQEDVYIASNDFRPAPPRVELIPQWVRDEASTRRSRRLAYIVSGTAIAVTLGTYGFGFLSSQHAKDDMVEAQTMQDKASAEVAKFAAVTNLAIQTNSLLDTVQTQTAKSVNHQEVLNRFLAASAGSLKNPSISISTNGTGSCVSTDPFNQVPLAGCITFGGEGDPTSLLRDLGAEPWFSDAFIPSVGQGENGAQTISGSVGITMSALPTTEEGQ